MLLRDVNNLTAYLGRWAPELLDTWYGEEMWALFESGALQADMPLTGAFEHDEHMADIGSVREAIEDARQEALIRQQGREAGSPTPRRDRAQGGELARTGPRRAHAVPTRRCALPASRRLDRGDVDLAHLHHGVEGAFGRGSVGAGEGLGQGAGRDLPRQAPLVLAPAAGTFLAAVVDDRVPQAIGLGLVVGGDLERERP